MGIIMIKFIVTLVADKYKETVSKSDITLYNHRSELNTTIYMVLSAFGQPRTIKSILVEMPKVEGKKDPVGEIKKELENKNKEVEELKA